MAALYPPIVASSMPAFDVDIANNEGVKIYFTLPDYMEPRWMEQIHVTIRRQTSNVGVVNSNIGFLMKEPKKEQDTNRYYIILKGNEDIRKSIQNVSSEQDSDSEVVVTYNTGFEAGVIYKIQLRTSSVADRNSEEYGDNSVDYYSRNANTYSEWSTVSLIKAIYAPNFYINDFTEGINNYFSYELPEFMGVYEDTYSVEEGQGENKTQKTIHSTEYLKYWRMRLLDENYNENKKSELSKHLLVDSDWKIVSSNNYNFDTTSLSLDCSLPYEMKQDKTYKLLFEIRTNNEYTDEKVYTFTYEPAGINEIPGSLTTYINEEEGYIKIFFNPSVEINNSNICLRRSDSKTNFLVWEDLKNETVDVISPYNEDSQQGGWTYYDFTAESGRAYKYLIQKRDTRGRRGKPTYDSLSGNSASSPGKNIGQWEYAFLLESNASGDLNYTKQLKLKYDFQISSWKTNLSESKTDTIGSKYPYIRRNGNMYYRSFPITGTITAYMDNADLFTSKEQLFDNYANYNQTENKNYYEDVYMKFHKLEGYYSRQYDYTYERQFREKVEQFLYNNKPKLYKSMQEGNVLIKLMEVSLTPKNELGRLIYTFSATAYEIDEPTIENFNKYNLLKVGTYSPYIVRKEMHLGQVPIPQNGFEAGKDIVGTDKSTAAKSSIAAEELYGETINNTKVTDIKLKWIRLTVESDPYLIFKPANGNNILLDEDAINILNNITDKSQISTLYKIGVLPQNKGVLYLGTLIYITSQTDTIPIIIPVGNNVYQVQDDELDIKGIIPAKDGTIMYIDYVAQVYIDNDASEDPVYIAIEPIIGQKIGTYKESNNLIKEITESYEQDFIDDEGQHIKQYLQGIKKILIDTQPGTEIRLKTSDINDSINITDESTIFIVDETGQLSFDPCDSSITITDLRINGILNSGVYLPVDALIFYTANLRRDTLL